MQPSGMRPSGSGDGGEGDRPGSRRLTTIIPIAVIVVIAVVVGAIVLLGGGDDDGGETTSGTVGVTDAASEWADVELQDGVMPYDVAVADGTADEIEWGPRCDTEIGRLALPLFPQQPCLAPFDGDNGGETATGVTADSVKVVVYLAQPNDPVLKVVYSQIQNDDTTDQVWETYQSFVAMFEKYYELYGRRVELIRYDATGTILDPVAATADAEAIANDIRPFMVLGGPLLTNAFADTLAANKIMCVSCGPGQPNDWYVERAPYVWDIQKNPTQNQQLSAEYIGKRLQGKPAVFAGDESMHGTERVFGYVHVISGETSQQLEDAYVAELGKYDVALARIEKYASPTELGGTGRDMINRLKAAGVTTVIFAGDPLAPQTLTRIATEQEYFPEWVMTGTVLVDTTAFSRTYDQQQWAHAFGPSNLFARVDPTKAGAAYLHQWYYGKAAPADQTLAILVPNLQFFFNGAQLTGPNLTPEEFQNALFSIPIIPSTPVTPQISYGNRGFFGKNTDFNALDDQTEIWWDAAATGPDELNRSGTGMWRYVAGGKRYLPGEWPETDPDVFVEAGTVLIFDEPPAEAAIDANYTPLK